MQCGRRAWFGGFVGAATTCALGTYASADASAAAAPFELLPLEAPGRGAQRAVLLVPRHLAPGARVRLLVALHGLGEAHDPALGVRAWPALYGLRSAYDRLVRAPVTALGTRGEWTPERLAEVNQSLAVAPFRGLAVACPFTPSFRDAPDRTAAVAGYADWLVEALVPAARRVAPIADGPGAVSIDGCSMGGPYALEAFVRHPEAFGALGVVQPAFGAHRAMGYAERIAPHAGSRAIGLLTSRGDPFHDATRALGRELERRGVSPTLRVLPGPHDQPWLREAGTIEMLLFHERGR